MFREILHLFLRTSFSIFFISYNRRIHQKTHTFFIHFHPPEKTRNVLWVYSIFCDPYTTVFLLKQLVQAVYVYERLLHGTNHMGHVDTTTNRF